jgi:hypothetical protein
MLWALGGGYDVRVSRAEIEAALESLRHEHGMDRDGGDHLVRAVIRHARTLAEAERDELQRHLLALVDAEEPGVWPHALEVVVRTGGPATGRRLAPMLATRERGPEWSDAVVLALLRLGSADAMSTCREYVREELRHNHLGALPIVGWLYRVDPTFALPLAARFFADILVSEPPRRTADTLRRHIGGQLEGLTATSPGLVLDLLDAVAMLDAGSGQRLAAMMLEHLHGATATAELGERTVEALGPAVQLRAG